MGLQGARAHAEWKIAKCPDEIGPWSIPRLRCCRCRRRDIDPIHGGFAWSFVRRDGRTRCPSRRAVIEGSFHGVRLETLNLSRLFSSPPSYPEGGRVSLRLPSFFSIFTSSLSSGRQLFFTYIYILYIREAVYERGHSRFRYISVVDMYSPRAFCTFSTFICIYYIHVRIYIYCAGMYVSSALYPAK